MQVLSTQFIAKPIMSVQSSDILGTVKGLIIKQESLKIVAIAVKVGKSNNEHYLLPADIRFFNKEKILVDSYQKLSEFEDLVRYQYDITNNYNLIAKKVKTSSGKKLGKVKEFMFDPAHWFVTKLSIKPQFVRNVFYTKLLIDREDIVKTEDRAIIVKDNYAKLKKPAAVVLPARS